MISITPNLYNNIMSETCVDIKDAQSQKQKKNKKNKKMPPRSNQRLATTRMPKVTTLKF
jgi:hypothetical protein